MLDGIDFDIEMGTGQNWDVLARTLTDLGQQRKVYLSAAPQCKIPDDFLDGAIRAGVFDYVWVQFYNNPLCQYANGNADTLLNFWRQWSGIQGKELFLGVPAAPEAAPSGGFIPPDALINQVLPSIKSTPNYGGVMVWNKRFDNGYSSAIKSGV